MVARSSDGVMTFNITVDIAAPVEEVWAVMTDIERWPEWRPFETGIQRLDDGPLALGSRAKGASGRVDGDCHGRSQFCVDDPRLGRMGHRAPFSCRG